MNIQTELNSMNEHSSFLFKSVESIMNIVNNLPALVFINEAWMENGVYHVRNIFANRLAYIYTGYTPEDCIKMGCDFAKIIIHPDEYPRSPESFNHLTHPDHAGDWFTASYRFRIKSGLYLWGYGSVNLMNVQSPDEHPLFLNCLIPVCDPLRLDNVAKTMLEENRKNGRAIVEKLISDREMQVLELVAFGYSMTMIQEKLGIAENTLKSHLYNLHSKLQVHNMQALACFAWQYGIIGQ
jgi:DNA-binding CsgD family transcriptional regulator